MADFHPLPSLSSKASPPFDALNKDAEKRAKACTPAIMPSLDHLSMADYSKVYEPSDDTYLLLDGISLTDFEDKSYIALEIGCGTGVPIVYLAQQLQERIPHHSHTYLCTDINADALRIAHGTGQQNGVPVSPKHSHLATELLPDFEHNVDILLFNPPYVPTPDDEVGSLGIEASWAGGVHGRRVVDEALPQMAQLLRKPSGIAYMITVDDNLPEDLKEQFDKLGLSMEPWVRRRARNEYLSVQRITWKS